uniref:Ovule protein n=2 Tax=Mesocestoides corti TaxID=53468 RepID=A0A5K3G0Q2_MESCO
MSRIWIPTSPLKYFNKLTPSPLSNRLITFVGQILLEVPRLIPLSVLYVCRNHVVSTVRE